jgi:hypothetical protein
MEKIRLLLSGNTNLQYYIDAVNAACGEATAKYLPDISTDYDGLILWEETILIRNTIIKK